MEYKGGFLKVLIMSAFLTLIYSINLWAQVNSPKAVLSKYMDTPEVAEVYQFALLEKVATVLDFRLYKLFNYEDPDISAATDEISKSLTQQVRLQLVQDRFHNTIVTKVTDPKVIELVEEVMRDLGFSQVQIKNAKIQYSFGEVNAYTYGFDKNDVVVVIYTALLELAKNKPHELQAVLGHELGHIIGKHVLSDLQLSMMLNRVVKIAMSKNPLHNIEDLPPEANSRLKKVMEDFQIRSFTTHFKMHEGAARKAVSGVMNSLKRVPNETSAEELVKLSQIFLLEVVRGMNTLEIPERTKVFFTQLATLLGSTYRPNIEDLAEHVSILMRAISREKEMSADLLGVSVVDPYVSVRFQMAVGGGGGLPDKASRKDVQEAVARIKQSLDLVQESASKEELAEILGANGSDHPETNIRVLNQVMLSRNYQILAMRNPFLRLVVLRDKLAARIQSLEGLIKNFEKDSRMKAQVIKLREVAQILEEAKKNLTQDIVALVKNLEGEKVNPRINNLIEYRLNDRQFGLALIDYFNRVIQDPQIDKMQREYFKQKLNKVKAELAQPDELIQDVLNAADVSPVNKERLQFALSQPDTQDIEALRTKMLMEQNAGRRGSRADMKISIGMRKSSGLQLNVPENCFTTLQSL